jgi:hypothetical protein
MKQDLNRAGRPKPLRRTAARSFSLATKQQRFQEVGGRCEACGELIGDGTDWRRAIYHHRRLVSDPMSATKRRVLRRTAWCCIRRATTTQSSFTTCMGFIRTISEGSRDADSRAAGEARRRFITLAAPRGADLGLALPRWGGLAAFFSHPALIAP